MRRNHGHFTGGAALRSRRALALAGLAALLAALCVAATALGDQPVTVRAGNLELTVNGTVTPRALPKKKMVPIGLDVSGKIATVDGTHPPALTSAVVDTDKNGTIDAKGVPVCRAPELQARTTAAAEKVCKKAIVGSGTTDVQLAFPEQAPIELHSKLLAFNGGVKGGTTTIYIHAFLTSPVTSAVVTTVKISKEHKGRFGTRSVASIPKIAGGYGSVTAFNLNFAKKLFTYKGHKHGYLLARCADGRFLAKAEAIFADGTKLGPAEIVRPCTSKG